MQRRSAQPSLFRVIGRDESGHGVIELALSLVVLLPLILLPFGFSHVLSVRESLSNLSHEAANMAHRECKTLAQNPLRFQECLREAATTVKTSGEKTLVSGSLSVLISTYEYAPGAMSASARVAGSAQGLTVNRVTSGARFLSQYAKQKVFKLFHQGSSNNLKVAASTAPSVLEEKQIIAIAEVRFLESSPLGIFTPPSLSPEYREVTVY